MSGQKILDGLSEALRDALGLDGPRHARHNLDGAIIDAEHGKFDDICLRTMRRVRDQLSEVEDILDRAQGTEARRAETHSGSVGDDGPVPERDAP